MNNNNNNNNGSLNENQYFSVKHNLQDFFGMPYIIQWKAVLECYSIYYYPAHFNIMTQETVLLENMVSFCQGITDVGHTFLLWAQHVSASWKDKDILWSLIKHEGLILRLDRDYSHNYWKNKRKMESVNCFTTHGTTCFIVQYLCYKKENT